jgi:hypothetical protein
MNDHRQESRFSKFNHAASWFILGVATAAGFSLRPLDLGPFIYGALFGSFILYVALMVLMKKALREFVHFYNDNLDQFGDDHHDADWWKNDEPPPY